MEIYAQMDDFVLVKTREDGIIPFGFVVNWEEKKVTGKGTNLFSFLKGGDWGVPDLLKEEKEEIIVLVEKFIKETN